MREHTMLRIVEIALGLATFAGAIATGLAGTMREVAVYGGATVVCALLLVACGHLEEPR